MPKKLMPGDPNRGLYKRGDVWWLYYRHKGKRVRVSLDTTNLRYAVVKAGMLRGRPAVSFEANPLLSLSKEYVAAEEAKGNFTPSSARSTKYAIMNSISRLGIKYTDDCHDGICEILYANLQSLSEASARTITMRFHAFLAWLHSNDFLPAKPTGVEFSRKRLVAKREDSYTFAEARQIIAAIPKERADLKFVFFAGFFCGLRKNEIISMRPGWLDLAKGVIKIPAFEEVKEKGGVRVWRTKSKLARSIPLHKDFKAFLVGEYRWTPSDLYMLHPEAESETYRYDPRKPFELHVAAFRKAHLAMMGARRLSMHTMRHSFISELANSGKYSSTQISMWSGDQVRTIESNYMHPNVKGGELDDL